MFDDDDDMPDDPSVLEEEPTFRTQQRIIGVPKIVKCPNGEMIVGTIINETFMYIELRWPMLVDQHIAKIHGEDFPLLTMTRYATGVFEDFITLNKDQLVWWNDTDDAVDKFYQNMLPKVYPSYEKMKKAQLREERKVYVAEDDTELEALVTKLTIQKPARTVADLIDLSTGVSKMQAPEDGEPDEEFETDEREED